MNADEIRATMEPFDQERWLPPPPWTAEQVKPWEEAHGHDVRLKCYVEFGCLAEEAAINRRIENLERERDDLNAWIKVERQRLKDLIARWKQRAEETVTDPSVIQDHPWRKIALRGCAFELEDAIKEEP